MREILFRGQTRRYGEKVNMGGEKQPGKWVYGGILQGIGCYSVIYGVKKGEIDKYSVYSDTVGQYTGLTDKNGKKIFEGDIIKTHYCNAKKASFTEQVVFHNGRFCSLYKMPGAGNGKMWANLPDGVPHLSQDKNVYMESCEVIGNIHDNPELLGGADNGE